jgi:hypothetical protein
MKDRLDACAAEEISIPWKISRHARMLGYPHVAKECLAAVACTYARTIASERYQESSYSMNFELVEESLRRNVTDESEGDWIRTRMYASVGNEYYWREDSASAASFYAMALRRNPFMIDVAGKALLLALGKPGEYIRKRLLASR